MSIDEFWSIIDRVHDGSGGDVAHKCELLKQELRALPPEDFLSFGKHFGECYSRTYTWDLWGAAYLICGGCGDDSFMDFRSSLVCMGREVFENAVANPDSLAEAAIDPETCATQQYSITIGQVCEERDNELQPFRGPQDKASTKAHPRKPSGEEFKEWEMSKRFPKLTAKFGYNDANYLYMKEAEELRAKRDKIAVEVATLMLESGIIPSCGLIPTFRITAPTLRSGRAPRSTGRAHTWEPFDLEELLYWRAVAHLEGLSADELKRRRPDIRADKLRCDVGSYPITDFDQWVESLKERGFT